MKYLNIAIFILLSTIYLSLSSEIKFSTNFLEIFFSKESIKLFNVAKKLGYSNEILISKKGFSDKSLDELYEILNEIKKMPEISKAEISLYPSSKMKGYLVRNYFLLADFNNTTITGEVIKSRLQNIYDNINTSPIYEPINSYDPLGLFKTNMNFNERYLKLKGYGYLLKASTTIDTANATKARELYNKINKIVQEHKDVITFAPFYYLVENSAYIKNDAQKIMLFATVMLLVIYFFILKNHKLFFNTILVIASSILSAIILSYLVFGDINILALVFGVSVTTISIDYMFHYYFHNTFRTKKFIFVKRVFFGFVTTLIVFIIFTFIDIELFSELAFFSGVSLTVAYTLFSWVFIYLDIPSPKLQEKNIESKNFNPTYILVASIIMLIYSYENLHFDTNMRNLDYNNVKLLKLSQKFSNGLQRDKYQSVMLSAKSEESLLQAYENQLKIYHSMLGVGRFVLSKRLCQEKLNTLKAYNFKEIKKDMMKYAKEIGFNKVFSKSYAGIENLDCQMGVIDDMPFKIVKDEGKHYTIAYMDVKEKIKESDSLQVVNLAKSLSKDTQTMKDSIVRYMIISIFAIIFILFLASGVKLLYPLSYLLFPLSSVLFAISLFGEVNIMHMFALVILVAIGIDYGIYMNNTTTLVQTRKAIQFALLSTFAGFGVLIFSNTQALHSIGLVITVGIGAIFILMRINR